MARGKYDLPIEKGDERVRCKRIEILNTINAMPIVSIWEEVVILRSNGNEEAIQEMPFHQVKITQEELEEVFPIKNPADDSELGMEGDGSGVMAGLYSWVRKIQLKRDAAQSPPAPGTEV